MATLVSFWSLFGNRMADLGLIDSKLGLYIKINVNNGQNKFEVHISKNVAKMAILWPKIGQRHFGARASHGHNPTSRKFYISSQMRFFLNSVARSLRSQVCLFFCGLARKFRSQIFNTGPIHEQGRSQDFSLGGCRLASFADASNPAVKRVCLFFLWPRSQISLANF